MPIIVFLHTATGGAFSSAIACTISTSRSTIILAGHVRSARQAFSSDQISVNGKIIASTLVPSSSLAN